MRLVTAVTTTAASTDCGTWYSAGVSHSSTTSTRLIANSVAQPVLAPAYRLMAEREKDALVAKLPHRPLLILARPWPIRSWFSFHCSLERWLSTLALEAVSRKLTSVTTSTGISNEPRSDQGSQPGQCSVGRPWGRCPTTAPPASA